MNSTKIRKLYVAGIDTPKISVHLIDRVLYWYIDEAIAIGDDVDNYSIYNGFLYRKGIPYPCIVSPGYFMPLTPIPSEVIADNNIFIVLNNFLLNYGQNEDIKKIIKIIKQERRNKTN